LGEATSESGAEAGGEESTGEGDEARDGASGGGIAQE
jgi:hypothetical protein